jgi:hypothetical protein
LVAAPPAYQTYELDAINALSPHAISLARSGDQAMIDAILRIARTSNTYVYRSGSTIWEPISTTTLISPYVRSYPWDQNTISEWAAAVSAVPYSEEVGMAVVDMLLRLALRNTIRRYIPIDVWAWLKKRLSLPPECQGRDEGTKGSVVYHIRQLGDFDILKSYFLLVWSEWNRLEGFNEMRAILEQDVYGIGMHLYREELIKRLDHILGELDRGLEYIGQHQPMGWEPDIEWRKEQYRSLREALLEVERTMVDDLAGMSRTDRVQLKH